ncbi:hypothetical protein CJU89_4794 [Yarrowia sp. B02]|nr:hypothetical protein CJU89_4794 [Yarrowia sp. B02]
MPKTRSKVDKPAPNKKKASAKGKAKVDETLRHEEKEPEVAEEAAKEKSPEVVVKEEQDPQDDLKIPESSGGLAENTDYIALTSALALLTRQQETSKRDLVRLSQMRQQAVDEPEQFLEKVKSGEVSFPKGLFVTMVPKIDWTQYDFENRELDAAVVRQRKESEKGVVEAVPLFNQ